MRLIPAENWIPEVFEQPHPTVGDAVSKGRMRKGEAQPQSKLTEDDVRYVLAHPEISLRKMAAQLGVGHTAIHDIRKGRKWTHITNEWESGQ